MNEHSNFAVLRRAANCSAGLLLDAAVVSISCIGTLGVGAVPYFKYFKV